MRTYCLWIQKVKSGLRLVLVIYIVYFFIGLRHYWLFSYPHPAWSCMFILSINVLFINCVCVWLTIVLWSILPHPYLGGHILFRDLARHTHTLAFKRLVLTLQGLSFFLLRMVVRRGGGRLDPPLLKSLIMMLFTSNLVHLFFDIKGTNW